MLNYQRVSDSIVLLYLLKYIIVLYGGCFVCWTLRLPVVGRPSRDIKGSSGTRVVGWRWLEMRRHSTHVDRHSRHPSSSLLEIMEAAWGDVSTDGDSLNVCWLKCIMMYHMIHGICEHAQRTSSLRMCNMLYENDACILHTHILICSRYLSRRQSEIIQHRTCHLEAVWACMDNLILWFFSHWNSLPSWTELEQEPSNRLTLCWGYFTWKQHLGNTFLTCLL